MATHPEQRVREGAEALRLASEAVAITGGKDVTMLDTLAAAQAEQGQFEAAIQVVEQLLVLAKSSGQPGQADQLSIRLKLYRKGQPCRDQSLTQ